MLETKDIPKYQDFYDKTVKHLIDQGCRSFGSLGGSLGLCLYRDDHGNKCAIGLHIPDHLYSSRLEGCSVDSLKGHHYQEFRGSLGDLDILFLTQLQGLHDEEEHWGPSGLNTYGRTCAINIAKEYGLVPYTF